MKIYILRHGQTNFNRDGRYQGIVDKDLNEFGRRQAELLGKRLQKYNIGIIYSSDFRRVVETSQIINKYIGTDIVIREELREINLGAWDTLTMEERYKSHEAYAKEWEKHLEDLPYPEGECGGDVCKRAMKIIDEIICKPCENAAVVTSGGTAMILLSHFLGLEQYKRFSSTIDNCSMSIVDYDKFNQKFTVKCINDTGHLEGMD